MRFEIERKKKRINLKENSVFLFDCLRPGRFLDAYTYVCAPMCLCMYEFELCA